MCHFEPLGKPRICRGARYDAAVARHTRLYRSYLAMAGVEDPATVSYRQAVAVESDAVRLDLPVDYQRWTTVLADHAAYWEDPTHAPRWRRTAPLPDGVATQRPAWPIERLAARKSRRWARPRRADREAGSTTLWTLLGAVLGSVVVGGFATLWANANAYGTDFAARSYDQSVLTSKVRDRLLSDIAKAALPAEVSATTITAQRPDEGDLVRYEIVDGNLNVSYGPIGTTDWSAVAATNSATGLGEDSSFSVEATGSLVRVVLDLPGGQEDDPEVDTPVFVRAGAVSLEN